MRYITSAPTRTGCKESQNVLMSRWISQFVCNLNSPKNFTCPCGKLRTEFTSLIAKSTRPRLSDTTFFASSRSSFLKLDIKWARYYAIQSHENHRINGNNKIFANLFNTRHWVVFEIKVQYQIPTLHNKSNNKGCYTFSKKLKLTYIGNLAKPFKTN